MKNFLRCAVPGLLLLGLLATPCFAQTVKIGTVDMKKVFDHYWKKKAAEDQLQVLKDDIAKEVKNMDDEFNVVRKEYDDASKAADDQNVSPEERDKRRKLAADKFKRMRDLQDGYRTYNSNANSRLMEQAQRMRGKIIDEVRNVTAAKAKAMGFSLVIDVAAQSVNDTPVVLYTDNQNDMTDAILVELNRSAPVATTDDKPAARTNDSKAVGKK